MNVNSALSANSSGDALKQAVGIQMLNTVMDTQTSQANTLLQDFAKSQSSNAASVTPHLGQNFDIRV